jgi:polar amino acid transport system ATP-binding protein
LATPSTTSKTYDKIIRFEDVDKSFGSNVVLNQMNFSIQPGERVTLIGPSGSGKTTILRLLMTLEKVTGGVIWVEGEPLTHEKRGEQLKPASEKYLREKRRKIGMVFQQFNLFPNMKVLENVTEAPVSVLGESKEQAREKGLRLLDRVGLKQKADAHPSQLSGGQQQRVAIVRALAMRPELMLLDEVTSALDPELVAEVLNVIRELAEGGMTMLIATHEMGFARDIADRVCFLDAGLILEEGDPEAIFSAPREPRTQQFLQRIIDAGRL